MTFKLINRSKALHILRSHKVTGLARRATSGRAILRPSHPRSYQACSKSPPIPYDLDKRMTYKWETLNNSNNHISQGMRQSQANQLRCASNYIICRELTVQNNSRTLTTIIHIGIWVTHILHVGHPKSSNTC